MSEQGNHSRSARRHRRLRFEEMEKRLLLSTVPVFTFVEDGVTFSVFDRYAMNDSGAILSKTLPGTFTYYDPSGNATDVTPPGELQGLSFGRVEIDNNNQFYSLASSEGDDILRWTDGGAVQAISLDPNNPSPSEDDPDFQVFDYLVNGAGSIVAMGQYDDSSDDTKTYLVTPNGASSVVSDLLSLEAMTSDGSVLASIRENFDTVSSLRVYSSGLTSHVVIADQTLFKSIGLPNISADGDVVVFMGALQPGLNLTPEQMSRLGVTPGVESGGALYAAILSGSSYVLYRIYGHGNDGILDVDESVWPMSVVDDRPEDFSYQLRSEGFNVSSSNRPSVRITEANGARSIEITVEKGGRISTTSANIVKITAVLDSSVDSKGFPGTIGLPQRVAAADYSTPTQLSVGKHLLRASLLDANASGQVLFFAVYSQPGAPTGQAIVKATEHTRPLLLIPGIFGSFVAADDNDPSTSKEDELERWLLTRGMKPEYYRIDPLAEVYRNIIDTLITPESEGGPGYRYQSTGPLGDTLYVVAYDWRLSVAPTDHNLDGLLTSITVDTLTDDKFQYGVDYLGAALKAARDDWANRYGVELDSVDIVAHSMGGLLVRSYIQSAAYGGTAEKPLPMVENLITVGTPYLGAPKAFNGWANNFISDTAYRFIMAPLVNFAYQKVIDGRAIIDHADPALKITRESISTGSSPDPLKFLRMYVPSVRDIIATYDFLLDENGQPIDVNANPDFLEYRNNLLLDLNARSALYKYSTQVASFTQLYGTDSETIVEVQRNIAKPTDTARTVRPFQFDTSYAPKDGAYFRDEELEEMGDGTVPTESGRGHRPTETPFAIERWYSANDVPTTELTNGVQSDDPTSHSGLLSNLDVLSRILTSLGKPVGMGAIVTGTRYWLPWFDVDITDIRNARITFLTDPVNAYIQDGMGRRLGWTLSTGSLAEIPGSVFFGGADGLGWVMGEIVEPLSLVVIGDGAMHYVNVQVEAGGREGANTSTAAIPIGEMRQFPITLRSPVENVPHIDGDYNDDGVTDGADFLTWQRNFGSSANPAGSGADGNRNGMIDPSDLAVWTANFGNIPYIGGDYNDDGVADGADFLTWQRNFGSTANPAGSGADGNRNGMIDPFDLAVWTANFARDFASIGDYNHDGHTDGFDFLMWQRSFGSSNLASDGDRTGFVDANDLTVWTNHFGSPVNAARSAFTSVSPITHPATMATLTDPAKKQDLTTKLATITSLSNPSPVQAFGISRVTRGKGGTNEEECFLPTANSASYGGHNNLILRPDLIEKLLGSTAYSRWRLDLVDGVSYRCFGQSLMDEASLDAAFAESAGMTPKRP